MYAHLLCEALPIEQTCYSYQKHELMNYASICKPYCEETFHPNR